MRCVRPGTTAALLFLTLVCIVLFADHALAQSSPFGAPRPPAQPMDGLFGWVLQKQAEFYRSLSGAIRSAKADGSAVWGLFGLSFAYGIFHAAGPGHGKGVISSYVVANDETWTRGVVLSFASALLQALVAVAIVGLAAVLLNATANTMAQTVRYIEIVSYGLIVLLGLRLTWTKGRAFIAAWRGQADEHGHDHAHHDHHHDHGHHHHDHGHVHDEHCGHSHGPEPAELAGPGGWKRGLTAVVAVGARPCSGAILVLVFALAQGLFWAGVAATFIMGLGTAITVAAIAVFAASARDLARRFAASRPGGGMLLLRGIEVAAAIAVVLFGAGLLTGYLISERMMGFT
jgi:ABC-type nickel/cobalt efflux system permease component RcnA